jgi:hypothetical protein
MKKLLFFLFLLIPMFCIGQSNIVNGETGLSSRTKINTSFRRIDTLDLKVDSISLITPSIVIASDTTNNKPLKKGNLLITPTFIYISNDTVRGGWVKIN